MGWGAGLAGTYQVQPHSIKRLPLSIAVALSWRLPDPTGVPLVVPNMQAQAAALCQFPGTEF